MPLALDPAVCNYKVHEETRFPLGLYNYPYSWEIVQPIQRIPKYLKYLWILYPMIPSGKQPHNYGKSPIFYGKIRYKWPFSIAFC